MVIKVDLHKNISNVPDGITLEFPFDKQMNDYLFENRFYARWNSTIRKRLISFSEKNRSECIRLLKKLENDWKEKHTVLISEIAVQTIFTEKNLEIKKENNKAFDFQPNETRYPRVSKIEENQKSLSFFSDDFENPRVLKTLDSKKEPQPNPRVPSVLCKVPKGITLYDFQKETINYLVNKGCRGLMSLDMGLGKSATTISLLNSVQETLPALIIVPASLKYNWQNEIEKFSYKKLKVYIFTNKSTDEDFKKRYDIYIINYDIVKKWIGWLSAKTQLAPRARVQGEAQGKLDFQFKTIVLDEGHYIKNSKTQRSKAIMTLAKGIDKRIILTGTPILNRPIEAHNLISFINPKLFPNKLKFAMRYCRAYKRRIAGRLIWDMSGSSNEQELNKILKEEMMIRFMKKDVLKDLPDKTRTIINLDSELKQSFKTIMDTIKEQKELKKLQKSKGSNSVPQGIISDRLKSISTIMFGEIEKLKQEAVIAKIPQSIEFIENIVETGGKVIVFVNHKFVVNQLMNHFGKIAVKLDGSMNAEDRQKSVDRFQNDSSVKVFVGSIKAAGVGITLTAGNNVVFLEYDWTPAQHIQCEDRALRVGQKNNVNVYYLTLNNSIDAYIAKVLEKKQKVIESILDSGERVKNSNKSMFDELLSVIKKGSK